VRANSDRVRRRRIPLQTAFPFLLVLTFIVGCQDDTDRLSEHLAKADAYFEQTRFAEAAIEYRTSLQIEPNNADAHYRLALAYFELGSPAEGFWELRETVRLDPLNADAVIEFSRIAILAKEANQALRTLDALLALRSSAVDATSPSAGPENEDVRVRLMRGQVLDALARHDEANEAYKRAIAGAPENELALHALARSETRAQRQHEARNVWERLLELHPSFENYTQMARAAPRLVADRDSSARLREKLLMRALDYAESGDRPRAYEQLTNFYVAKRRIPEALALLERGARDEENPVEILYLLARLHRSEGNGERADQLLEEAAEASPDDPKVHRVLAAYRARKGDFEGALAALDRAVSLDTEDDLSRIQQAEILMELGFRQQRKTEVDLAHGILKEVLARQPRNPFALLADAKYQINQKSPELALGQLKTSLEVKPDWAEAHYLMGIAFSSLKDYAKARVELARALELDSSLVGAKAALSHVHFQLGEWRHCINRGREYLRAVGSDNKVRLQVAEAMVRLGLPEAAIAELQRIPKAARNDEVRFALGRIALSRGDLEKARSAFESANQASPHHPEIIEALLAVDQIEHRVDETKARIASALAEKPNNSELYRLRGIVFFNEGRIDEAEADFKHAIELAPRDLQGYERLARFYARIGRLDNTVEVYESALALIPKAAEIHHSLGLLHERLGQIERAIPRYESAIRYGPNNVAAKNNLAYLYADRGEHLGRALDLAREARRLLPDDPSIADTLGWVLYKRGLSDAAVSYLKEAASNTDPNAPTIAMIRYHLAEVLAATGKTTEALQSVDQSLKSLAAQRRARLTRGEAAGTPDDWAKNARALRARLEATPASLKE
jgi:tetratricopeptide (TPR) repeat protein